MRVTTLLISLLLLLSCRQQQPASKPQLSFKDSVLQLTYAYSDSLGVLDTTDDCYRTFRAYRRDDTAYFRKMLRDLDHAKRRRQEEPWDSCIHQSRLKDLGAEEAYRFVYTAAFSVDAVDITITRKGDSSTLHYILFRTDSCRIGKEFDKKLTPKDWEAFSQSISRADFWGLRSFNGLQGVDGNDIEVWGFDSKYAFRGNPPRSAYVHRWLLARSSLHEPFTLLLKLAGAKPPPF